MQDFERDIMKQFGRGAIDHPVEDNPATQEEQPAVCEPTEPATIASGEVAKVCPRCNILKERSHFWRNKATKDGLEPYCKECKLAASRSYAAKKRNKTATPKCKVVADAFPEDRIRHRSRVIEEMRSSAIVPDISNPHAAPIIAVNVSEWSDQRLVDELRDRGYHVTARKTTIVEL